MRGINERFINDLKNGCLSFFLDEVKNKSSELCIEIRKGYINIYYKGGNLLRITQKKSGYAFYFDARYCLRKKGEINRENYEILKNLPSDDADAYIKNFETMKKEMEGWFEEYPKKEREFQHRLLVNNPQVVDIEYATPRSEVTGKKLNMRLDMLMTDADRLIIVENKFGIGAITGDAGVGKHYRDICDLLNTPDVYDELVCSVENIARAKYELGLIETPIKCIDKTKTEILFLLADFNENSETLKNELKTMNITYPIGILKMKSEDSLIDLSKIEKI